MTQSQEQLLEDDEISPLDGTIFPYEDLLILSKAGVLVPVIKSYLRVIAKEFHPDKVKARNIFGEVDPDRLQYPSCLTKAIDAINRCKTQDDAERLLDGYGADLRAAAATINELRSTLENMMGEGKVDLEALSRITSEQVAALEAKVSRLTEQNTSLEASAKQYGQTAKTVQQEKQIALEQLATQKTGYEKKLATQKREATAQLEAANREWQQKYDDDMEAAKKMMGDAKEGTGIFGRLFGKKAPKEQETELPEPEAKTQEAELPEVDPSEKEPQEPEAEAPEAKPKDVEPPKEETKVVEQTALPTDLAELKETTASIEERLKQDDDLDSSKPEQAKAITSGYAGIKKDLAAVKTSAEETKTSYQRLIEQTKERLRQVSGFIGYLGGLRNRFAKKVSGLYKAVRNIADDKPDLAISLGPDLLLIYDGLSSEGSAYTSALMARAHALKGDIESGKPHIENAAGLREESAELQKDAQANYGIGETQLRFDLLEEAFKSLEIANSSLSADSPIKRDVVFAMGYAADKLGKKDDAKKYYGQAVLLDRNAMEIKLGVKTGSKQ